MIATMVEAHSRKRRKLLLDFYAENSTTPEGTGHDDLHCEKSTVAADEDEATDVKLARLMSLYPHLDQEFLLDVLVSFEGNVTAALAALQAKHGAHEAATPNALPSLHKEKLRTTSVPGIQTSLLSSFRSVPKSVPSPGSARPLTKRGKTLYLYTPEDVAAHTPCSIIHNFLPADEANALLTELLEESKTFKPYTFQLFGNKAQSRHTSSIYVSTKEEAKLYSSEYNLDGAYRTDVRILTPRLRAVSDRVQKAVNEQVRQRILTHYPNKQKLRYQSPKEWIPNVAFVNCYDGPSECVGYHSDQLTFLGPRAIIGSLSLGVAREFRVRKIVARDENDSEDSGSSKTETTTEASSPTKKKNNRLPDHISDAQGQISIHLPHNSLLVMHAEMQEEWKHSIPPVQTISPHPIAGNRRINITYRWYRESLQPHRIPRCRCGVPAILKCVQRKRSNRGRYMWMCYAGNSPESKTGCSFFQWAEFDDDGEPLWISSSHENGEWNSR